MKKFFGASFLFLLLTAGLALSSDRTVTVPISGRGNDTFNTSWAGVDYATATTVFSTANILLFAGEGVVYGFVTTPFTMLNDYVSFRDTGNVAAPLAPFNDTATNNEICRVSAASATATNVNIGGNYSFPQPVRFRQGATARVVGNSVTAIMYLFHKFGP